MSKRQIGSDEVVSSRITEFVHDHTVLQSSKSIEAAIKRALSSETLNDAFDALYGFNTFDFDKALALIAVMHGMAAFFNKIEQTSAVNLRFDANRALDTIAELGDTAYETNALYSDDEGDDEDEDDEDDKGKRKLPTDRF